MNKHLPDPVIKELWEIKDATADRYSTPAEYLAQLQSREEKKPARSPKRSRTRAPVNRKAVA